jgi:hypothetical protein
LNSNWVGFGRTLGREITDLLVDVTAFLSTSSTLGTVAEAFVVAENSQLTVVAADSRSSEQLAWQRVLDARASPRSDTALDTVRPLGSGSIVPGGSPDPIIGPQPVTSRVDASKLPGLRGVELLDQLGLLSRSQLNGFVSKHSATVTTLISSPPSASAVAALWSSWPQATRSNLIATAPQLVGSLDGVDYAARDAANRSVLAQTESGIRRQLDRAQTGRAAKDVLTQRLHMLEQVRLALQTGQSGNSRSLVRLDASGQGRAVIVIGDASTADYVDYLIPGMFSDVATQIAVLANGSDAIATQQRSWLTTLNPGVPASQVPTVATMAWIGYQTPNIVNVASMQLAREGQKALAQSITGLRAERAAVPGGKQPYVAILAHSYGTTTAMLALQNDDISVDALAVVGSPGSPARTASQLNVANDNVWVGAGSTDPVPQTGLFGSQPTSASYGAHRFGVDGATDPLTGASMSSVVGHDGYFVDGTESLRNMVLIGIGRGDLVLGLDGSSALALAKSHATVPKGPLL